MPTSLVKPDCYLRTQNHVLWLCFTHGGVQQISQPWHERKRMLDDICKFHSSWEILHSIARTNSLGCHCQCPAYNYTSVTSRSLRHFPISSNHMPVPCPRISSLSLLQAHFHWTERSSSCHITYNAGTCCFRAWVAYRHLFSWSHPCQSKDDISLPSVFPDCVSGS